MELFSIFEPHKLLKGVVVKDIDEKFFEIGLNGLAIILEESEEQSGIGFCIFGELV